jgi:hypothetical protein
MMFTDVRREAHIRRVLRKLSAQRVALVLQPGNVWVVEKAVGDDERTDAALKTCFIRGWVEPLENAVPTGCLTPAGELPPGNIFDRVGPMCRLTDSGSSVVNRSQQWVLTSILLALLSLLTAIH